MFPDSPFTLTNKATGLCLVKKYTRCVELRWTTQNRLYVTSTKKCLGAQGRSVGSEVSMYDCDDQSPLQQWECHNNTLLALKGPPGHPYGSPWVHRKDGLKIGQLYSIGGNAYGKPCMFPFYYKNRWYGDCTTYDSSIKRLWCAIETKYNRELWGYCPTTSNEHWTKNIATGAYYQVNLESALTWSQAQVSCTQQGASLLSISDPNDQAFVSGRTKVWIGLVLDPEHGWQWTNGQPYRYMRWSGGNPQPNPGHNCAVIETGQQTWESSTCGKQLGYVCYKSGTPPPTFTLEQGFCANPWIPYSGHYAMRECRKEAGDLLSIRHVEDQSFVLSQLGYASTDELWIGLNDQRTEGLFEWIDQSPVLFSSWQYGEPSVSGDSEDCVLMTGEKGNWADRSCDETHGFICMKQSTTERTGEEVNLDGWKKHGSYCYFVGTQTKTFAEANEDCKSTNSYLADVSNGVDNAFLVSLVGMRPEKYFWIGLSNMRDIDQFVWTNTDQVKFTHWNHNMPEYFYTLYLPQNTFILYTCPRISKYIFPETIDNIWSYVFLVDCPVNYLKKKKFPRPPRSCGSAQEKTWYEARDYCRAIGGDLLSIHSSDQLHGRGWIGLHVPDANTGYAWSDGTPVRLSQIFFSFMGEPNNFNNAESCVEFRIYNWDESGSWNDVNCESYNDWLCQIRAGVTPKQPQITLYQVYFNTTVDGWLEWKGNQYYINKNSMSMEAARQFCQRSHGDLVTITSYWGTCNCGEELKSICKRSSSAPVNTTVAPTEPPAGGCPLSWTQFNSKVRIHSTWEDARRKCISIGGNLASIPTRDVQAFLTIKMAAATPIDLWIGLHSIQHDEFYWTDGKPRKYTNWDYSPNPVLPNTYVTLGNDSIKVVTKNLTWDEAKANCEKDKATLASLRNEWTQAFVELMALTIKTPLWIGLNKNQTNGYYRYIDGWYMSFANWANGEPRQDKPCVFMDVDGKWKTGYCNTSISSACLQTTDVAPTESSLYPGVCPEETEVEYRQSFSWIPYKGHCYMFVAEDVEWADAASSCARHGGTLASIGDPSEQEFIKKNVETFQSAHSAFWVGLVFFALGTWQWLDKTLMDYTNWGEEEPRSDYGEVRSSDGTWSTGRKWHDRAYICKTPKGEEPQGPQDRQSRTHNVLAVVLVILVISGLAAVAIYYYKRSPSSFPTFENPCTPTTPSLTWSTPKHS
uniref:Mannose receptor, C type 1b n=1 Tax=Neogobius melanostomus TaxID=47308 RepID=A0A8C6TG71_9GOBI